MWIVVAITLSSSPVATLPASARSTEPTPLVRVPFPQEDGSLTPYTFELGYQLVTLVYDTLFWRDRDGLAQPWLAKSAAASADGHKLTIRLAEGPRWHDGEPVTSADVAFTFRFVADHPHPRFSPQLKAISRVDTPDARTAVITLRHAAPGFLDQPLADVPILPAHIWSALAPGTVAPPGLPVGSGPYRLVDHQVGQSYRFEANQSYFRGPPGVATIEVPVIGDAEATFRALERQEVDMIPVTLSEDLSERLEGLGTKVLEGPTYLGTALLLNTRQAPFDRPEVRKAVTHAINLDRIRRSIGNVVAAERGYLHPESRWSSPEVLHPYDEEKARQEVAGLGVAPVEVLAPDNDPVKREVGKQVAVALERAGLTATSRAVPRSEMTRALGQDGSTPSFTAAIGVTPSLASYDPDFLAHIFGSDPATAALNATGYASPAFDILAARIAETVDLATRKAVVTEALQLLTNDAPAVPLFFPTGAFAYRPAVYDRWVYVKGTGIFDKRSFVDPSPEAEPSTTRPSTATTAGPGNGDSDTGGSGISLGMVGLGMVALALVLGLLGLLRR